MDDDEKRAKIIDARMKLRERHRAHATEKPMGSGPPNRHGMPHLPPGQTATTKWPVLDLGTHPSIAKERWKLTVDGACRRPVTLDWAAFNALEQVSDTSDFHCVTTWSRFDVPWRGVRLADVIAMVEPKDEARFLMCHGYDNYTTNISLAEALKPDVLLVHTADGKPLTQEHGGPVRIITPQLYAWKGTKWIKRLELMITNRPGFWEENGYSMTANPWLDDRYS